MKSSYNNIIGAPVLCVGDSAKGFTLTITPPRELLPDIARKSVDYLLRNGSPEEREQMRVLAQEIQEFFQ